MTNETIYYTVYKTVNLITGQIYIGVHKTKNLNDSYIGTGGRRFQAQVKHFGVHNFKKEIIFLADSLEEMYDIEKILVCKTLITRKDIYNENEGGRGGWEILHQLGVQEEKKTIARNKISAAQLNQWKDPEIRDKRMKGLLKANRDRNKIDKGRKTRRANFELGIFKKPDRSYTQTEEYRQMMAESIRKKHEIDPTYSENLSKSQKAQWDKNEERKRKTGARLAERNKSLEVREKAKIRNKLKRESKYELILHFGVHYDDPNFDDVITLALDITSNKSWKRKNLKQYIEYVEEKKKLKE